MERELVRVCSAAEAIVLAGAAGRWARVGSTRVCVRAPSLTDAIDLPSSARRYLVRIEVAEGGPENGTAAPDDAARVLLSLFGPYLA